jgi:hypothetical protein
VCQCRGASALAELSPRQSVSSGSSSSSDPIRSFRPVHERPDGRGHEHHDCQEGAQSRGDEDRLQPDEGTEEAAEERSYQCPGPGAHIHRRIDSPRWVLEDKSDSLPFTVGLHAETMCCDDVLRVR